MKGRHIVSDMYGVECIADIETMKNALVSAAEGRGASVLNVYVKEFVPQGVTILIALSESHISIHTSPEYEYIALDIFTCGEKVKPYLILEDIIKVFRPENYTTWDLFRGTECYP